MQTFDFGADVMRVMEFLRRQLDGWSYWLFWSKSGGQQSVFDDKPFGLRSRGDEPPRPEGTGGGESRLVRAEWVPAAHDASCLFCAALRVTVLGGPFEARRGEVRFERLETDVAMITLTQRREGLTRAQLDTYERPVWYQTQEPVDRIIAADFSLKVIPFTWVALLQSWREEVAGQGGEPGSGSVVTSGAQGRRAGGGDGRTGRLSRVPRWAWVGVGVAAAAVAGLAANVLSAHLGGVSGLVAAAVLVAFVGVQVVAEWMVR